MSAIVYIILAFLTIVAHIALVPFAELPCAVLVTILFFFSRTSALILAGCIGFILDIFSPVFGVQLILYPLVIVLAARVSTALLTDQSLLSFGVLMLGSFVLFRFLFSMTYVVLAHVILMPGSPSFLHSGQTFAVGFAAQVVMIFIFYGIGIVIANRLSPSLRYAQRA